MSIYYMEEKYKLFNHKNKTNKQNKTYKLENKTIFILINKIKNIKIS